MDGSCGLPVLFCLALDACGFGCGRGACGGGGSAPTSSLRRATESLTQADVQMVVQAAATAADPTPWPSPSLTAWDAFSPCTKGRPRRPQLPGNFGAMIPSDDLAVALARTGAFFSNDQAPLSSRTVRFISGIHFPPGVENTANAALYGIENTNRGCNLAASLSATVPPATTIAGASPGYGIITGKADLNDSDPTAVNPGGVPDFQERARSGRNRRRRPRIRTLRNTSRSPQPA